jgi:hypothetical protein
MEVSIHWVSRADVHVSLEEILFAVSKIEYSGVFQKAANN